MADVPPSHSPQRATAPAPASLTKAWQDYINARIKRRLDKHSEHMAWAIAQTVGNDVIAAERRIEKLEAELAELRNQLDSERGTRQLRAVPPAMIA